MINLTIIHYIYLLFIIIILGTMIKKRDCSLVCILGIILIALISTKSITASVIGIFNSFIYAITELLPTILIISIIAGLSKILRYTGINELMIRPFTKLIRNPFMAYWTIGIIMMVISYFFWPSPAVALIGAVLVPVAVKAGLPAIGAAISMNIFGHGIALSTDYIIQAAPKLTADAAGVPVDAVIKASIPLILIMGAVVTVSSYLMLKKDLKSGNLDTEIYEIHSDEEDEPNSELLSPISKKIFSLMIPALFILDVVLMFIFNLKGGDATALIGGTALFILVVISLKAFKNKALEEITNNFVAGLQFGFKVFGVVIPIAAFFYLGDSGFTAIMGNHLPVGSLGIVNDLGYALSQVIPIGRFFSAFTITGIGAITGLDGSGFSGISLAGSSAKLFGNAAGISIPTLTALGQLSAIWVGGGTLVPWAIIPVSAICKVSPFEVAKRNFKPVVMGLIITTLFAFFTL